jgi:hypothetical protein
MPAAPVEVSETPENPENAEKVSNLLIGIPLGERLGIQDAHEGQTITLTARVSGVNGGSIEIEPLSAVVADTSEIPEDEEMESFDVERPLPAVKSPKDMGVRLNLEEDDY